MPCCMLGFNFKIQDDIDPQQLWMLSTHMSFAQGGISLPH